MNPLLIGSVLDIGTKVIDRLFPDPKQRAHAQIELLKLQQAGEFKEIDSYVELARGQMEINKIEASSDLFRGGWRPACGWICVCGLFYNAILQPIVPELIAMTTGKAMTLQPADTEVLMTLLGGLLGLGGMRSFEKIKGR